MNQRPKLFWSLLGWLLAACGGLRAAEIAADLSVTNFPSDPYAFAMYTYIGEADLKEADTGQSDSRARMHEWEGLAALPYWNAGAHTLLAGAGVKYNRFEFQNLDLGDENVYALRLPLDYIHDAGGDWMFWGNVTPGLFSDLEGLNRDDYKTQLHGMALYRWLPQLHLAAGLAYDSAFGDDDLYPLGGLIWRAHSQWLVSLILPAPAVAWRPHRKLLVYADARPAGDKWNVRVDGEPGDFDFKLECWRIGAGLEYNLSGALWMHLGGGMEIDRRYEVSNSAGELYKSDVDDAWFCRAGLLCR